MHIMSTHMVLDLVFRTFGLFFHLAAVNQMQTRDWTQPGFHRTANGSSVSLYMEHNP